MTLSGEWNFKFRQGRYSGSHSSFYSRQVNLIRLPRAVEEQAMRVMRKRQGSLLNPSDALVVHQYRSKQHWVEFNDDLVEGTPEGIELV